MEQEVLVQGNILVSGSEDVLAERFWCHTTGYFGRKTFWKASVTKVRRHYRLNVIGDFGARFGSIIVWRRILVNSRNCLKHFQRGKSIVLSRKSKK